MARAVDGMSGALTELRFIVGSADDVPDGEVFDIVTSLLVMHHQPDNGTKLAYLKGLRNRLAPGGRLIHAGVCFDSNEEFARLIPAFQAYADIIGVSADVVRVEIDAIPNLPVVSADRTRQLFAEVGLAQPQEVFRTLWYRCWVS